MQGFANFSDSLLSGGLLIFLALALGGVPWALFVLPRWDGPAGERTLRRCIGLLAIGALGVAVCQLTTLTLKFLVVSQYAGDGAWWDFADTLQCRAGLTRITLALLLAAAAVWLRRQPRQSARWVVVGGLAVGLAVSGAWLVHGAGRPGDRAALMSLTVLHQVGAAVWGGGLMQLIGLWQLAQRDAGVAPLWDAVIARFSRLAVGSLLLFLLASVPLTFAYVGSWNGLYGTGYGSLILTKVGLLGIALGLAFFNFRAGRASETRGDTTALRTRVPYLVQAEFIVLIVLLFTAASLSTQPPAIDTPNERATWQEVVAVFSPKLPSLRTPSLDTMRHDASDAYAVTGGERTGAAYSWSNFSHNVAGLFLLVLSLLAFAAAAGVRWARHWPLGLVAIGVFVFLRTSANSDTWPFGPVSFWENTLGNAEVLQHRLGALLAFTLGVMEWRARTSDRRSGPLPYVFPVLAGLGGILLLTHSHVAFEAKSSFLIQVTHTTMGALAALMAGARLLELRLTAPASRVAGAAANIALLLIALVLVFYREANVVVQ